jgi:hypothetical protein
LLIEIEKLDGHLSIHSAADGEQSPIRYVAPVLRGVLRIILQALETA